MKYVAVVSRHRGQPKTMEFEAPDIRDAAAHVREKYPLWGDDPHRGFKIDEAENVVGASKRQRII